MDVIGYVRVSTSEQADSGLGLAAQRRAIHDECVRRAWLLHEVHEDAGASGKSTARRPALDRALRQLKAGEATTLVVAKVDRLSRSLVDFAGLMDRARRESWSLVALDLGVDTTTPSGEMLANVMASFAQYERRLIGQRTKDALAVKRAQGVVLGRPLTARDQVVVRIREMRVKGLSFAAIADALNTVDEPTFHGGRQWHGATVRQVLRSRGAA